MNIHTPTIVGDVTASGNVAGTTYGSDSSVADAELKYINTLSSNAQDQLDARCLESVFGTAIGTGLTLDGTTLKTHAALQSIAGITETNGGLLYGTADNTYAWLAAGTAGYLLQGNGAGAPSWTNTPNIGTASGTSFDAGATTVYGSRAITVDTGGVLNIDIGSASGDDFTVDTTKLVVEGDTGNVGIGTTSPLSKLNIAQSGVTGFSEGFTISEASSYRGTMFLSGAGASGPLCINRGESAGTGLSILHGGKVGIGTTSQGSFADNFSDLVVGATSGDNGVTIASGSSSTGTLAFADGTTTTQAYEGYIQYNHSDNSMLFGTGHTTRMTLDSTGNLAFSSGTGISFAATSDAAGMTSELLDDYEEGTWTPSLTFGGATTGITYTAQLGLYTRIGNVVAVSCRIILSSKGSATGDASLDGLPFTVANDAGAYAGASVWTNYITFADFIQTYTQPNTTYFPLWEVTNAGSLTRITNSDFANNSYLVLYTVYRAA